MEIGQIGWATFSCSLGCFTGSRWVLFNPRGNGRPRRRLVSCLSCLSFQENKFGSKHSPWPECLGDDLHAKGNMHHAIAVGCHRWTDKPTVWTRIDMCAHHFCLFINKGHGVNHYSWSKTIIKEIVVLQRIELRVWYLICNIISIHFGEV